MFNKLSIIAFFLILASTADIASGGELDSGEEYPRLAAMLIGNHEYQDPVFQEQIARLDLVVLQFLPLFEKWTGQSISSVLARMKTMNPRVKFLQYVILNEQYVDASGWPGIGQKLSAETWWLYRQGASGSIVRGEGREKQGETNYTKFAPKDSKGRSYNEWFAEWVYEYFFKDVPEWDGLYVDNVWVRPRHDGDWNRDGTTDGSGSDRAKRWHREGMADFFRVASSRLPNMAMTGNIGQWGMQEDRFVEYDGLLDGGNLEHYIGASWSPEGQMYNGDINNWGSWDLMMKRFRRVLPQVKDAAAIIFNQLGLPDDYRSFRYGFGSCLMDDAHYSFSSALANYKTVEWFDEYDLAGAASTKWLGRAIDPPQYSAWKDGVYRRRFENGMVLVNPRGNGEQNVNIESGYKRFDGKQDPITNNGKPVSNVQLRDRDAIFLVRADAKGIARPKAPKLEAE